MKINEGQISIFTLEDGSLFGQIKGLTGISDGIGFHLDEPSPNPYMNPVIKVFSRSNVELLRNYTLSESSSSINDGILTRLEMY